MKSFLVVWIDEPFWGGARHERGVRTLASAKRLARVAAGFVLDAAGRMIADYSEEI